jgi:hypothetical protein
VVPFRADLDNLSLPRHKVAARLLLLSRRRCAHSTGKVATMRQYVWVVLGGIISVLETGCVVLPSAENPVFIRPDPAMTVENPVWLPLGSEPEAYGKVFEKILDIVDDYFEISYTNRYAGRIETFPRISPGFEQFWRPGSPDAYQRLEATLQTIRHRGVILLEPAHDGGVFVHVTIFKELEDLPRPTRATAGSAAFRSDNTVERQFEVIDQTVFEPNWIPIGRDGPLEQLILQRLKKCL